MPHAVLPMSAAVRAPDHGRPLLTLASAAGDIQTLKDRSGSVSAVSLNPGMHKALSEPSEHLWKVWV